MHYCLRMDTHLEMTTDKQNKHPRSGAYLHYILSGYSDLKCIILTSKDIISISESYTNITRYIIVC